MPIDPIATNQVEVIRGPAALRYGSTSIGGVVSATNNRIPTALPTCPAPAFQSYGLPAKAPLADAQTAACSTVETRTAVNSVDRGVDGAILLDAGGGNFALHADAFGRKTSDYNVPSNPYLFDQTRPFNGRQPNSATQSDGGSLGGSYIFQDGFIGAAVTQNDILYRIPGIDGADHQTRIDGHQTKFTAKGEYHPHEAVIDAVRFWVGAVDYHHDEIGLADPTDPSTVGVRQTLHQQGAGGPPRSAADAIQRALCGRHHRLRHTGRASETDGTEPRRSRQPAQRVMGPQQQQQDRRLRLQRAEIHRHDQGSGRRPRRAGQSLRYHAGVHS